MSTKTVYIVQRKLSGGSGWIDVLSTHDKALAEAEARTMSEQLNLNTRVIVRCEAEVMSLAPVPPSPASELVYKVEQEYRVDEFYDTAHGWVTGTTLYRDFAHAQDFLKVRRLARPDHPVRIVVVSPATVTER